jgi:hypothetical protein
MIRPLLHTIRRRLLQQAFVRVLAETWLVGFGLLLAIAAGLALAGRPLGTPVVLFSASIIGLLGIAAAATVVWLKRPSAADVARQLDTPANARDRYSTALAFASVAEPTAFQTLALQECERHLRAVDVAALTPWRLPRALKRLPIPIIALGLLQLFAVGGSQSQPLQASPDAATLELARNLDTVRQRLEAQKAPPNEELKKISDALKKTAAQLRSEANAPDQEAARLRQLSTLEDLLRAASQRSALEELADALAKAPATQAAAEALRKGDPGKAADMLAALAKSMGEGALSESQLDSLQEALHAAAEQLGAASSLGSAASKVATAMRQGNSGEAERAMAQLSNVIRNQQSSRQASQSRSGQAMQSMASQLQELKSGQGQGQGKNGENASASLPQPGSGRSQTALSDFSKPGPGENPGIGPQPGAGPAATEKDFGTKNSPFKKDETAASGFSAPSILEGLLGEGETLRSLVPGKAQTETAATGYRSLYEATAPAAEDALNRENIPLGSRLFIKRYFQAIRPER